MQNMYARGYKILWRKDCTIIYLHNKYYIRMETTLKIKYLVLNRNVMQMQCRAKLAKFHKRVDFSFSINKYQIKNLYERERKWR